MKTNYTNTAAAVTVTVINATTTFIQNIVEYTNNGYVWL